MPKYVVTDNVTGQQFIVDAPEGASAEEALGYFKQQHRATKAAAEPPIELPTFDYEKELAAISQLAPVERGFWGNIKAGTKRATQELGNLAWNELPALVESGLGFDERALENLKAAQARREEIEKETPTQYKSLEDIKGLGDVLPYFGERLGEQLPNLATMVGTGGAGSILARRAVEKAAEKKLAGLAEQRLGAAAEREAAKRSAAAEAEAAKQSAAAEGLKPEFAAALPEEQLAAIRAGIVPKEVTPEAISQSAASMAARLTPGAQLAAAEKGALAGAALGAYATTAPAMFQNLYEETGEVAPGAAAIFGAIDAGLNTVLPYKLSKPVRTAVALKLLEKSGMEPSVLKSVGKTALKESGINVATESASAAINQIAEKVVDENENTWNSDDWKAVVEGGVNGLILGAPFGAYMGMQEGRGVKKEFKAKRDEEARVKQEAEAKAAAERAAQEKLVAEQQELQVLPQQMAELDAQIAEFQQGLGEKPSREEQFKLSGLQVKRKEMQDRFDYLSKTPEERAQIDAAKVQPAAPAAPKEINIEDFTPAHFFDEIGVPVEKIKQFIKAANVGKKEADKLGVPFNEKAVGPNAAKLIDILNAFDPRAVGMTEEEGLAAMQQIDRVLGTHPNLQADAIRETTLKGLKEDGFEAYYKKLLDGRKAGVLNETDMSIFNDLGVEVERVQDTNPKLAKYLKEQQDEVAKRIEKTAKKVAKGEKPLKPEAPQPIGPFTKEYLGGYGLGAPNNPVKKLLFNRDISTPEAADAVINDLKAANVFTDKSKYSGAVLKILADHPILQEAFDRAFPKEEITAGVKPPIEDRARKAWDAFMGTHGIRYDDLDEESRAFIHDEVGEGDALTLEQVRKLEKIGMDRKKEDLTPPPQTPPPQTPPPQTPPPQTPPLPVDRATTYSPSDYGKFRFPSKEEQDEVRAGVTGKSLPDIVKFVAENAPQASFRTIAEAVHKILTKLEANGLTYTTKFDQSRPTDFGAVSPSERTFYLNTNDRTSGFSYVTVLHEAIHAATADILQFGRYRRHPDARAFLTPALIKTIEDYEDLLKTARKEVIRRREAVNRIVSRYGRVDSNLVDSVTKLKFTKDEAEALFSHAVDYGMANVHEFTTMAMTSRPFQDFLESIPYKTNKSFYTEFVNLVRRLLNIPAKANSALSAVLRHAETIMEGQGALTKEQISDIKDLYAATPSIAVPLRNAVEGAEPVPPAAKSTPERRDFVARIQHFEKKPIAEAVAQAMNPQERLDTSTSLAANADRIRSAIFKKTDELIEQMPVWSQDAATWVRDKIEILSEKGRDFALRFLSLRQLADIARQINPRLADGIEKLSTRVAERNAAMDRYREQIEKFIFDARKILNKYDQPTRDRFNRLVRETTMEQTPMDEPEDTVRQRILSEAKTASEAQEKIDTYLRIKAEFDSLPKDIREQVYFPLQKLYDDMGGKFRSLIEEVSDKVGALGTGNKILLQMLKRKLNPYFPLYRKGDYWIRFVDKDGQENVMAFETPGERRAARRDLVAQKLVSSDKEITDFSRLTELNLDSLPPTSQFKQVLKLLKEAKVDEQVQEEVFRNYLDLFPTNSVMQQFKHRKNVRGARDDALSALADVGTRIAMNVVQFDHVNKIDDALAEAKGAIPRTDTTILEQAIADNLEKRMKFIKSPIQKGAFNKFASWAGYNSYRYFLLGNISSAIVNLTQLPIVTFSILGGRYGAGQALAAMREASKMWWKGGWDNNTTMTLPFTDKNMSDRTFYRPNLDPSVLKTLGVTQDQINQLYIRAINEGAIRRSTGQDLMYMREHGVTDVTGGETSLDKAANMYQRTEHALSWVFQNSERFNREVTLLAAYNLEFKRLKAERKLSDADAHEGAIRGAIRTVEDANGSAMVETGPEIFQMGPGRLVGTFKRFALSQIYLATKLLAKSLKGASSEEQKVARRQLGYIMGTAFAFSGLKGMPFFGGINMLSSLLLGEGDEGEPMDLESLLLASSDVAARGPISAFTNIDISSRVGFTDLLWRDDPKRLAEVGLPTYVLETLGGPFMGILKNFGRAAELYEQGHTYRAIEAAVPAAIRNGMKSIRFAVDGATNKEGVPLVDDVNAYNLMMQLVGFTPNDLAVQYSKNEIKKRTDREGTQRRTALLDRLNIAKDLGDAEGIEEAQAMIDEYNSTSYGSLPGNRIGTDTMNKSYATHRKRLDQMSQTHGIYLGKPGSAKVQYLESKVGEG